MVCENCALLTRGLVKNFGHRRALNEIDLHVKKGEFFTLFGPNGAGKTTLIKILSTLLKPTSGFVWVNGINIEDSVTQLRRDIGFISHSTFLYDNLTAFENMKFYSRMYNIDNHEERIISLIGEMGLIERKDDPVRTFSKGMKQRLSIARGMINSPSIIFLDEPYSGLDQHASLMLKELLWKLKGRGRTIVMATHNLQRGLELCDRAAILAKGRIVYKDSIDEIEKNNFERLYFQHVEEKR